MITLVIIVEIIIMEISYGRIFDVLDHLLSKHNRHINLKITTCKQKGFLRMYVRSVILAS